MSVNGGKAAIIDTCFLYALFDPKDSHYPEAEKNTDLIETLPLAIPWPCLYEMVNTRFVKNPLNIHRFEILLKRANVKRIDDTPYRNNAYEQTMTWGSSRKRIISLVDMVIRFMLNDTSLHIGYLFTFNLRDFVDVCRKRSIEIVR